MEGLELISFQMISTAGTAKSTCFQAIKEAKAGRIAEAKKLIETANELFVEAHRVHAELIQREAGGNAVMMTMLLTHAEDQLMSAELSKDIAEEFIDLFENYKIERKTLVSE